MCNLLGFRFCERVRRLTPAPRLIMPPTVEAGIPKG
jgi:hypothetical protein